LVLGGTFQCPTNLIQGQSFTDGVSSVLGDKRYALITSQGWLGRGAADKLAAACGDAAATATIEANPSIGGISASVGVLGSVDAVVALGGGSVLDAAKALTAAAASGQTAFMAHLEDGAPLPPDMKIPTIIAVPTTSGTGSEVTRWGTIWGAGGAKHSVSDSQLYPAYAVLDPALCVSMPDTLTLSTGLDTLSHAMEAVWNNRHTPISDALASQAIRLVRANLELAIQKPDNVTIRRNMQTAAVLGGLAMGTTQTAIAHSISYPFTSQLGVPHGLACSFTLAECARYIATDHPERLAPIADGLQCQVERISEVIEKWFQDLAFPSALSVYTLGVESVDLVAGQLINPARAGNTIRPVGNPEAERIARSALKFLAH
jgi:phosphonate metabolism-associated iron-containing alcohol dehydrogenase